MTVWKACFASILLGITPPSALAEEPWRPLFNGNDLSGWHPIGGSADNWKVQEGVLFCTGGSGSQWLATDLEYADFELSLEFNVPKDGNSGVFLRAPEQGVPYVDGLEVQILDDFGEKWKNLNPDQFTGSVYAVAGPTKQVTKKAGQWQKMKVRCVGPQITITLNGQRIVEVDLAQFRQRADQVPGVLRTKGHIGLQNHGDPISFRNLRLRVIQPKTGDQRAK